MKLLLEHDHDSLHTLLVDLDQELAKSNTESAFNLLDLFWARLGVHIRAEHLQLFPALTELPSSAWSNDPGLPSHTQAQTVLTRLRDDHDFFMKELAQLIQIMREVVALQRPVGEMTNVRQRLDVVSQRLNRHNQLEETQVYLWPALLLDDEKIAQLSEGIQHELNNLPSRFSDQDGNETTNS
jgi:hypothetical protein